MPYEPKSFSMRSSIKSVSHDLIQVLSIKAMLYDTFNWYEVNDHDITDNFGVDFSTLIKNLEKGDL